MRRLISLHALWIAACLLPAGWLAGCATNPVTRQPEFVLMSEDREIALGRRLNPQILEEMGRYPDEALQAYVQSVGERLARVSDRPGLIYRFTVVDTPDVNAFALPGGYIYVARGLLAYLESEAELAAVLGHEIGHVAARHAVRQYTAATTVGILSAVIAGTTGVQGAGDLARVISTAIVRGYGRRHELEADRLGAIYLARAGYPPEAMLAVLRVLKAQEAFEKKLAEEEGREPRVYHGLFATHPDNDARLKAVIEAARPLLKGAPPSALDRDEAFLHRLDGLVYGQRAEDGITRGNRFYHGPLGFALRFPAGWRIENLPDRLIARAPGGELLIQLTTTDLNRRLTPREFLQRRLEVRNPREGRPLRIHGLPGYTALGRADTPWGRRMVRYVVVFLDDRAYIFAGASRTPNDPRRDRVTLETARSFHRLKPEERSLAEPLRLRLIRATAGLTYAELARRSALSDHAEDILRLLNHHWPSGEPLPGQLVKLVK